MTVPTITYYIPTSEPCCYPLIALRSQNSAADSSAYAPWGYIRPHLIVYVLCQALLAYMSSLTCILPYKLCAQYFVHKVAWFSPPIFWGTVSDTADCEHNENF